MRFISYPPQLIGKGHYGIWRVTAHYTNGIIHEQDCIAHTATEAKWKYLHIHGRVQGTISAESVRDLTSPFLFRK